MQSQPKKEIKCVIVGDYDADKAELLLSFMTRKPPNKSQYKTISHTIVNLRIVFGSMYTLSLWDTSKLEDNYKERLQCYENTNIFLVCFSVINPTSLTNVVNKWVPEIKSFNPNAVFILVGTKSDLRCNFPKMSTLCESNVEPIKFLEGRLAAKELGALHYLESSSFSMKGNEKVFEDVIEMGMNLNGVKHEILNPNSKYRCNIL